MIPIYHNTGNEPCGELAMYMKEKLFCGEIARAENFVALDGSDIHPGTRPICGACGNGIGFGDEAYTKK